MSGLVGGFGQVWPFLQICLFLFACTPLIALALPHQLERVSRRVSSMFDRVGKMALWLAIIAAIAIVLGQFAVIIGRYVFSWSASWLNEIVIYSFASMFLLAAASALREDAHVRVDIFRATMPEKAKAIVDLIGTYLLLLPVCWIILSSVSSSSSFANSWANLQGSRESDGLPIFFLFRTLVPVFAILMIVQATANAFKLALVVRGRLDRVTNDHIHQGHG